MTPQQAYYQRNKELIKQRAARWAKENPEKRREILRKNNAKNRAAKAAWHQEKSFGVVIERDRCAMCGTTDGGKYGLVIHHKDGCNGRCGQELNNDPANLVVLCRSCHPRVHGPWGLKEVV